MSDIAGADVGHKHDKLLAAKPTRLDMSGNLLLSYFILSGHIAFSERDSVRSYELADDRSIINH